MQRFEMRTLNSVQLFLSIRIIRDRKKKKIWLCQHLYIIKMISKFNLKEIKCLKISLIDLSFVSRKWTKAFKLDLKFVTWRKNRIRN
jgi:hypothetical protein